MNNSTQYQAVPTTTQRKCRCPCRLPDSSIFIFSPLSLFLGCLLLVFGVVQYKTAIVFNIEPSHCRVNSIVTKVMGRQKAGTIHPVWNVDVVQQSESNTVTKNPIVLRSGLQILGDDDYRSESSALQFANQEYSVGKIYPCYLRKDLPTDEDITIEKEYVKWKNPSQKRPFKYMFVGSVFIVVGIIILVLSILSELG